MKSRVIIFGVFACAAAGNALAYDVLGDWPTKFKTDSGYEFGIKGLYQADTDDFSNGGMDPATDATLFEVAARYSELDLNDRPVLGGSERDWTIGANWYIGQHLKLQANYVRAKTYDSPANSYLAQITPRIVELRTQIYF